MVSTAVELWGQLLYERKPCISFRMRDYFDWELGTTRKGEIMRINM